MPKRTLDSKIDDLLELFSLGSSRHSPIASYSKEKEQNGDDGELENALADAYQAKGMTQQAQEARGKAAQLLGGQNER